MFNYFWVGLLNPKHVVNGTNSNLDGLLKWTDGSDYIYSSGLPDTQILNGPIYCHRWLNIPVTNGAITSIPCNQFSAYYICEYECGKGK